MHMSIRWRGGIVAVVVEANLLGDESVLRYAERSGRAEYSEKWQRLKTHSKAFADDE
jgi:hypothetical protein